MTSTPTRGRTRPSAPTARIDRGRINYESGYVMFRELQPFAPTESDIVRRFGTVARPDTLKGDETVAPRLYERNDWSGGTDPSTFSQYVFEVTARTSVSRITLNAFNILQGSEVVTAGGRHAGARPRLHDRLRHRGDPDPRCGRGPGHRGDRVNYSYLPVRRGGAEDPDGDGAFRFRPESSKLALSTTWIYESKGAPGVEGRRPRLGPGADPHGRRESWPLRTRPIPGC